MTRIASMLNDQGIERVHVDMQDFSHTNTCYIGAPVRCRIEKVRRNSRGFRHQVCVCSDCSSHRVIRVCATRRHMAGRGRFASIARTPVFAARMALKAMQAMRAIRSSEEDIPISMPLVLPGSTTLTP